MNKEKLKNLIVSYKKNVGKNIAKARIDKGMKQKELAEALFIKPQQLYKWEKGISLPRPDTVILINNLLDTDIMHVKDK